MASSTDDRHGRLVHVELEAPPPQDLRAIRVWSEAVPESDADSIKRRSRRVRGPPSLPPKPAACRSVLERRATPSFLPLRDPSITARDYPASSDGSLALRRSRRRSSS